MQTIRSLTWQQIGTEGGFSPSPHPRRGYARSRCLSLASRLLWLGRPSENDSHDRDDKSDGPCQRTARRRPPPFRRLARLRSRYFTRLAQAQTRLALAAALLFVMIMFVRRPFSWSKPNEARRSRKPILAICTNMVSVSPETMSSPRVGCIRRPNKVNQRGNSCWAFYSTRATACLWIGSRLKSGSILRLVTGEESNRNISRAFATRSRRNLR